MTSSRNDSRMDVPAIAERLVALLTPFHRPVVAFSGGVDSAVVAMAAHLARGSAALAVTGVGASVSDTERQAARETARAIGIRHQEVDTDELANPAYVANAADRCYHCKSELYAVILRLIEQTYADQADVVILSGANADDWGDHRPGLAAASEAGVRHPLTELGIDKQQVRELARYWSLEAWDKPASPCLASRIAYGVAVTTERLRMVELAEEALRELGLRELRVRYHAGDLARIEIPLQWLPKLCQADIRTAIVARMRQAGFQAITLDLEGLRSGNLNDLIGVEELVRWRSAASSVQT